MAATAAGSTARPVSSDVGALTGIDGPAWESGVKAPNRPVTRGRPGARSPWTGVRMDDGNAGAVGFTPSGGDDPPWSGGRPDVAARAAAQSQAARSVTPAYAQPTQLTLDLGDTPRLEKGTGLPEMTGPERVRAELDILGLDASAHIVDFYAPMLDALGVVRSTDILRTRSRSEILIAGVKVATQTPPVRSGRRVVFLTLDDATGPVDATFFEDAQGPYATTVFHSWMLLVRGITRRTGPRGISVRATGAWELSGLWDAWTRGGLEAVLSALDLEDREAAARNEAALAAAARADGRALPTLTTIPARLGGSGGGREVGGDAATGLPVGDRAPAARARTDDEEFADVGLGGVGRSGRAGGMGGGSLPPGTRRVLVHASGFRQSPYADVKPAGESLRGGRALATSHTVPDGVTGGSGPFRDTGLPGDGHGREPGPEPGREPGHQPGHDHDGDDLHDLGQPPRKLWHASPGSSGH